MKMLCSKLAANRKVDTENWQFQIQQFAFNPPSTSTDVLNMPGDHTVAVMKIPNLKRHYETKHWNFDV